MANYFKLLAYVGVIALVLLMVDKGGARDSSFAFESIRVTKEARTLGFEEDLILQEEPVNTALVDTFKLAGGKNRKVLSMSVSN